jgi:hypothetical protein
MFFLSLNFLSPNFVEKISWPERCKCTFKQEIFVKKILIFLCNRFFFKCETDILTWKVIWYVPNRITVLYIYSKYKYIGSKNLFNTLIKHVEFVKILNSLLHWQSCYCLIIDLLSMSAVIVSFQKSNTWNRNPSCKLYI